jgi:hypothetical protein|tara:strand:- start:742 stop:858 length:117 start_codon:yes stop_codon:yes gene_type:complete
MNKKETPEEKKERLKKEKLFKEKMKKLQEKDSFIYKNF